MDAAAPAPRPSPSSRLDAIDALRGVAILLVVAYHAGPLAWRLAPYRIDGWLSPPRLGALWLAAPILHFGFSGVHLFFLLSGFCIHLRAARARAAGHSSTRIALRPFFLRRFLRIYPPYWIALALFALVIPLAARALGVAHPELGPTLLGPPAAASDVALHATMLHTFSTRSIFSINPAFWSLATEEQFYLFYPLVAIAIARFGMRRVLVAALFLSLAWRAVLVAVLPTDVAHFLAWRVWLHALWLPRWFEWLLGAALAESAARGVRLPPRRMIAIAALLLTAAMASRLHVAIDKLASDVLFGLGWAAAIAAALSSRITSLPARALAAVGRRAYGIYLVHQPVVDFPLLPTLLRAPVALACGLLFSSVCERPFERASRRVR